MDYTDLYNFQTPTGTIVPQGQKMLSGIQTKFQEIFGTDIDLSEETAIGRLIEAWAVNNQTVLGVTAQTANQFNINEATGIYLDAIAQIYGLERIAATSSRIMIKCYFSDDTTGTDTIPAGALVLCTANGVTFRVDSPIVNTLQVENGTGRIFATGTATAVEPGPIVAPIGSVNSIQTRVIGWVGVTNTSSLYIGTNLETDEAFRERIKASRPMGLGFEMHLLSALNRISGIYSSCILENNTGTRLIKKGIEIPPHSIFVGVDCIATDELLSQVAEAIARAKPVGTGMVDEGVPLASKITTELTYGFNNSYSQTITFYKTVKTAIKIDLSCSRGNYSGDDIESDIVEAIGEYLGTIGIGNTVYAAMISNYLASRLNIGITSIWLQKENSAVPADLSVEMMGYESPYAGSEHITLTIA